MIQLKAKHAFCLRAVRKLKKTFNSFLDKRIVIIPTVNYSNSSPNARSSNIIFGQTCNWFLGQENLHKSANTYKPQCSTIFLCLGTIHLTQFFLGLIRHIRRGTTVFMYSWHKFLYMNIWYKYNFYSQTPCYYWISCRLIWKWPSFWSYRSEWWRNRVSWIGKVGPTTSSCCWGIGEWKANDLWRLLW